MDITTKAREAEALLKHLGLTEYEAKAVLTLIKEGKVSAEKVSKSSGIPLPRVYDTMKSLSERGLVEISNTRPQTYRATDPTSFSELLKDDEKKRLADRLRAIDAVGPQFLETVSKIPMSLEADIEESIIASVKKKVNMEKIREESHSKVQNEMLVFAGDLSWIGKILPLIKSNVRKGVKYKIIWDKNSKDMLAIVRKAATAGVAMRYYGDIGGLRCIIADGFKVSIALKSRGGSDEETEYTTITINNGLIGDVFRRYFITLWDKATPAEKLFRK